MVEQYTTRKDFWSKQTVLILGAGNWGTVLSSLVSKNVAEVKLWTRSETHGLQMCSTRMNEKYLKNFSLAENVRPVSSFEAAFSVKPALIIFVLPSHTIREIAQKVSPYLTGAEWVIHATKGIEVSQDAGVYRMSEVLIQELPTRRVGVLSGPNLASEIARGLPAASIIASQFDEILEVGQSVFSTDYFRVYGSKDIIGVEWAGSLKNIFAIASGVIDSLDLGMNARATLLSRGVAEMLRFGNAFLAEESTFLGLAGMGDLVATGLSPLSRNFRVGQELARGLSKNEIIQALGSTAEGIRTTMLVSQIARARKIDMPIVFSIEKMLLGEWTVREAIQSLMSRPIKATEQ